MQVSETISRGLLSRAVIACRHDDLSHNVLQNRILKSILERLTKTEDVHTHIREALAATTEGFAHVSSIGITARDFGRIELHGNNAFYGFLLRVCELIFNSLMPAPGGNRFRFRNVLADPQTMGRIFQDFIRNFYKLEQMNFSVKADTFSWPFALDKGHGHHLIPSMNTDVSLNAADRTILIECKWAADTFQYSHGIKSLRSAHLYQLYAYVRNHPRSKRPAELEGLLLYPRVDEAVDVTVWLDGHRICIRTLDLQSDWPNIRDQLLAITDHPLTPGSI